MNELEYLRNRLKQLENADYPNAMFDIGHVRQTVELLIQGREIVEWERKYWETEYVDAGGDPDNENYYSRDTALHLERLNEWIKAVADD